MSATNIIIVVVDGLRASALGAYGNTTFPTPALDQFAAESALCDACYAASESLPANYRALWQSRHPLRPDFTDEQEPSLPRIVAQCGYSTVLITDDPELAALQSAAAIDQCIVIAESAAGADSRAEDVGQTALGRLFATVCEELAAGNDAGATNSELNKGGRPRLIWVHSRGMYGRWDAPLELQQMLIDEGDPPPREETTPPDIALHETDDPDIQFQSACAYAAQAMVLDACWSALMETLASDSSHARWLTMLIGVRGFPLGEHQRIGGIDGRMFADQLHVPWMLRFPDGRAALARTPALVTHLDLLPTLVDVLGQADDIDRSGDGSSILLLLASSRSAWREALLSSSESSAWAIRTPTWTLRRGHAVQIAHEPVVEADLLGSAELYVRPDDRWEANDIAKLCPDVVEELACVGDDIARRLAAGLPLLSAAAQGTGSSDAAAVSTISVAASDC